MTQQPPRATRMLEARRRFALLMKLMLAVCALVLVVCFYWLHATNTPMTLAFIGAIFVAVVGSLMLAAALMGLIFFSAASGADEDADGRDSGN
jgi:type III secretory pathway component EscU